MTDPARFDTPGGPAKPPRLPFDVPFAEAIAWAEQRRAILPAEFYGARLQAVRARSSSIAGLAALDQLQDVADSLAAATASGQTFREWQKALPAEVFELGAARRELIFRNAVQTHYGIGRTIQQRENAAARPYLMWDAINDSRTRPAHRAMDGHIAPVDDPIWKRWSPPAGHRCRCSRISLTEAQARARGYPKPAPAVEPDTGWAGDPTEGNEDLLRIIRERQASCATTFGAKKTRARGLWCDEGSAKDSLQAASRELQATPSESPLMASTRKIIEFVQAAALVADRQMSLVIGPVENAADILRLTGFDLAGFERMIDNYGVRHTLKQHGSAESESKRGQVAVTSEDFALIPLITSQPDAVWHDGKNKIGRDVIVFTKVIDGIGYRHVEEIRAKKKLVAADSMRKKKGPWGP